MSVGRKNTMIHIKAGQHDTEKDDDDQPEHTA